MPLHPPQLQVRRLLQAQGLPIHSRQPTDICLPATCGVLPVGAAVQVLPTLHQPQVSLLSSKAMQVWCGMPVIVVSIQSPRGGRAAPQQIEVDLSHCQESRGDSCLKHESL
ncbi:uncharacterized protein LOC119376869 [Rhipicephalus sanguineus]|uniref:uncharacterized protein LOC119376869 n=1 Tax=Rhipicephalus sanguineus TaxID=34632 RepID=UPI0018963479|nr:uncharacterized protein LOC119376869 [Rhipicephalus sanguineus]